MKKLALFFLAALLLPLAAPGQFLPLTDYSQQFDRGITIGTNVTTLVPGTIRWNASLSQLQYYHTGGYWTSIGSGSGGGAGSFVIRNVGEDGTNSWTPTGIDFDADTGFVVEDAAGGAVKVSLGSHWYYLVDGAGVSNKPSGQQDLRIVATSGVTCVTWNTNTSPWTLMLPLSTGPKGDPGTSFGVYRGAWESSTFYETGNYMLHGGSGYGVISNFTSSSSNPTNDSAYNVSFIRLWYSGADGEPGATGLGFSTFMDWDSEHGPYGVTNLVREGGALWYTTVGASSRPSLNTNEWNVLLRDGADGIAAIVTSNTVFGHRFDYDAFYPSNTIVYANYNPYGGYYVCADYNGAEYGGDPGDARLNDTDYFTKIWHFAKDGAPGAPGHATVINGVDGVGNMWFDPSGYQETKTYSNGVVLIHNQTTYAYKSAEPAAGVEPGNTSANPNWSDYWDVAAASGLPGGNYRFSKGWVEGATYSTNDVVVTTESGYEGIFWLCQSPATLSHPTNGLPDWDRLIDPQYRSFPLLSAAPVWSSLTAYETNQTVRYEYPASSGAWGTYVCISNTSAGQTPVSTAYWAPVAVGVRGPTGAAGSVTTYHIYTNSTTYYETNITVENISTNNYFYSVEALRLVETNRNDLYFDPGDGALTLLLDTTEPLFTDWLASYEPPVTEESDPVWAEFLASNLTNTIDARVSTIAVTGAVSSINGLDGGVTLVPGDGIGIETNAGTGELTISATGGGGGGVVSTPLIYLTSGGGTNVNVITANTANGLFLDLSAPTAVLIEEAANATNVSSFFSLELRGTNQLTLYTPGAVVTGFPERVWLRTNRTVGTVWRKFSGDTVWHVWEE